jgi:hypothetical protein
MSQQCFESKFVLKESRNLSDSTPNNAKLTEKLHKCAFNWSDRCVYCEVGFDDLKKKLSSCASEVFLRELRNKFEDSVLKGENKVIK